MSAKTGIAYLGNAMLKGPGVKIEYTPEQMEEYMKCSEDVIYFLNNYFYKKKSSIQSMRERERTKKY